MVCYLEAGGFPTFLELRLWSRCEDLHVCDGVAWEWAGAGDVDMVYESSQVRLIDAISMTGDRGRLQAACQSCHVRNI